jgi:hypothetical protein
MLRHSEAYPRVRFPYAIADTPRVVNRQFPASLKPCTGEFKRVRGFIQYSRAALCAVASSVICKTTP